MFKSKVVMLANAVDKIVLSKTPTEIDKITLTNHPEMFDKEKNTFLVNFNNEKYLFFSHQLSNIDWSVISRIPYSEITYPIIPRILILGLLLLIVTFIISKILAQVLGKTIAKPVIEVSSALKSLAKGHKNIKPINDYPQNEIGIMARSFNTFLATTELLKSDISELNETKNKLSYSLSLLNASLESTDDGILIIDKNRNISKWNKRFLEIWKITDETMELKRENLLLPNITDKILNSQNFLNTIEKVNEDPEMISFDIIKFTDGRIIERYSFPQRIEEEIVGRVWRYRDITKIKEAEISLQDSEEKHRVMFTQTVDAYCILNDGVFTDVNHAAQIMLGSPEGWLVGKTPMDISPEYQPDGELSSESVKKHMRIAYKTGKHSFNWIHCRFDGKEFPSKITLIKIKLKEKDLLLAIWKDVTEEREIAQKLETSEQNFRLFFETMEDLILISDYQGNIKYTNKIVQEKLGFSFTELSSMTILDLHENTIDINLEEIMTYLINEMVLIVLCQLRRKIID